MSLQTSIRTESSGRGQAHTIEVGLAALVFVSVVSVAIQAMPPGLAATPEATLERDAVHRTTAVDLLETSAANGALLETVLYWNPVAGTVAGPTDNRSYSAATPPTAFGRALERTFGSRELAYTLAVVYRTESTSGTPLIERQPLVESGVPSETAVTASRVVVIPADASLTAPGFGDRTLEDLDADSDERFYAPPTGDGAVYAAVEVELVVWRP